MTISVIIPFYNADRYIETCIETVQQQTFTDFEVLLVDDGSTDGSAPLAKKLIEGDGRFHLIASSHQGVSSARNEGLLAAQGKYICFVDVDDQVSPHYLQALYEDEIRSNADLVVHGLTHVFPDRQLAISVGQEGCFLIAEKSQRFFQAFDVCALGSVCGKLFKASMIREQGLRFDSNVYMCEDQDFVIRYMVAAERVLLSKITNYFYIASSGSGSLTYRGYPVEAKSFEIVNSSWKHLLSKYHCLALQQSYSFFVGSYLHRVLYAAIIHPQGVSSRRANLKDFERTFLDCYREHYHPETFYTRVLRFCLLHRLYHPFVWVQWMAEIRYSIVPKFV